MAPPEGKLIFFSCGYSILTMKVLRESISVIENSNENMFSQHTFRVKKLGPLLKSRKNYLRRYTSCEICMAFHFQINVLRQFF